MIVSDDGTQEIDIRNGSVAIIFTEEQDDLYGTSMSWSGCWQQC